MTQDEDSNSSTQVSERLSWIGDKVAFSKEFEDIYYAEEDGLEEARHTFIGANEIPERLKEEPQFHVGELGFGTGLNFFALWQLWAQRDLSPGQNLIFSSLERYPLSHQEIRYTLSRWPELSPFVEEFLAQYDPSQKENHLQFSSQVTLHLYLEDVSTSLHKISTPVDAWFFDGFAPVKNPEMWSTETFKVAYEKSKTGATFSTFSVAGFVKRNAKAAGFVIEKKKGFGRKRELLTGKKIDVSALGVKVRRQKIPDALVIGAGLAGTAAAYELAARGLRVQILERNPRVASEASSHRAGLVQPILSAEPIPASELSRRGYFYLFHHIEELKERTPALPHQLSGLVHSIPEDRSHRNWKQALLNFDKTGDHARFLDAEEASERTGTEISREVIYFPQGGWISPQSLCERRLAFYKDQIEVALECNALHLDFDEGTKLWTIKTAQKTYTAPRVILANAADASHFRFTQHLPLKKNRGQQVTLRASQKSATLRIPFSSEVYLTPAIQGFHVLGASVDRKDLSQEVRAHETQEMLDRISHHLPNLGLRDLEVVSTSVQYRASSNGALPLLGIVNPRFERSLLICAGFSGRGLIGSSLAGVVIADLITEPATPPAGLPNFVLDAISPLKFNQDVRAIDPQREIHA